MDFCYDWLLAQIRHDINKFLLILISYFACFGRNKINLKWQILPVKNVPALVMEGNRHTNKPKAMEDDDNTKPKQRNNNEATKTTTTTTQPKQ